MKLTPLQRLFKLLSAERREITQLYIFAALYGLISLSLPLGVQAIINFISMGQLSTAWVMLIAAVISGVAAGGFFQIMQLRIAERIQRRIFVKSTFEFSYRLPNMKWSALHNEYPPELMNRFFDTLTLQKGLSKILFDFSSSSLQIFFSLILLSIYHREFALLSIILTAILYLIFRYTGKLGIKTSLIESKYKYAIAHWLEEIARSLETFKLFGISPLPLKRADHLAEKYLGARENHFRVLMVKYIITQAFKLVVIGGLLIVGSILVVSNQLNIGQFVAIEIVVILLISSVEKLMLTIETVYDILTAIEKMGYVADIPLEDQNPEGIPVDLPSPNALSIQMQEVTYGIEDFKTLILDNFSFSVEEGEKVYIEGASTPIRQAFFTLISGLEDPDKGLIRINNHSIKVLSLTQLRAAIGFGFAHDSIFQGTVLENVCMGRENVSLDRLDHFAKITGLYMWVREIPNGWQTELLPFDRKTPKHIQRQLILTRLIANHPRLILLEDELLDIPESFKDSVIQYLFKDTDITVICFSNDDKVKKSAEREISFADINPNLSIGHA